MDFSSMLERICDIEARFPVNSWKLGKTPIWPLLRVKLYFALRNSTLLTNNANTPAPKDVKNGLPEKTAKWNGKADVIFFSRSNYREELDGVFWDRHCDPLRMAIEKKGISTVLFESAGPCGHRFPVALEKSFSTTSNDFKKPNISTAKLHKKFGLFRPSLTTNWDEYDFFLEELSRLNLKFKELKKFSKKSVVNKYLSLKSRSAESEKFLRKAKPKIVFITCYYSAKSLPTVWACRRLKIPIVDIQHGMQHHAAYQNWTAKTLGDLSFCPTHFWVWSNGDKKKLDKWVTNTASVNTITGGYLWADLIRTHGKECSLDHTILKSKGNRKIGMISLPTYEPQIPDYLIEAVKKSSDQILWLIRTHPRLPNIGKICIEKFETDIINSQTVAFASNTPLIKLLGICDLHLTWESTVIHEAHLSGVPSIAIEPDAETIFQKAKDAGFLIIANEKTLLKEISHLSESEAPPAKETEMHDLDTLSSLIRDAQTMKWS